MANYKKNINPEAEKPSEASQEKKPEQPAPGAPQAPVVETVPKEMSTPTLENQPREKAAPAPKVLDFSAEKIKLWRRRKQLQRKSPSRNRLRKRPLI